MEYGDDRQPYEEDELDRMRRRNQNRGHRSSSRRSSTGEIRDRDYESKRVNRTYDRYDDEDTPRSRSRSNRSKDYSGSGNSGRRRRRKKKGNGILTVLLIALLLFIGYQGVSMFRGGGYWTIAVFGVDSRDGNLGRGALSDVEMLCSINKKTGEIRLASVFRDSYLRIDSDNDYDKINEAYFKGGHEQAVSALESNLDLSIDDYATFNWKAVVDGINILGGVDLEITDKEFAYINSFITETVNSTGIGSVQLEHSGMNHLDGVQAVAYARLRLMDTDFNRTERQRKVLGLAMEKAKHADGKTLKNLASAIYPEISTSIGLNDLLTLARGAKKYYIGQTSGFPFSHQEMKIGKKACVIPTTLESNVIQLHSFLYDDENFTPSATVQTISNHIAEKTGLGQPGKDTESGKNIGAEGNTGENSGSSKKKNSETPAETANDAGNGNNQGAEASSENAENTENAENNANASVETSGSSVSSTIEALEPSNEEKNNGKEETKSAVVASPSPGNTDSVTGPGAKKESTSETPGNAKETNAILEAPGQASGNTSDGPAGAENGGPGVQSPQ
ncbi:LCP family protein [Brotaphodocola sp.]|uniref:LCP family protein n=1 Tax=Brotaphodocola sp. TaxID=3073577 RepID=UPI003D7E4DAA